MTFFGLESNEDTLTKKYINIIKDITYLCYAGKLGGISDIMDLTVHDRQLFLNEIQKIKADEEKEMNKTS